MRKGETNFWKAVYVASRTEKKVMERLVKEGINAYTPLRKTLRQWSDRKKWVTLPLLPGYVFVESDYTLKETILNTPGIVAFVRNLKEDALISNQEIDILKNIETLGYDAKVETMEIHPGDIVEIKQGPLKGFSAKVLEVGTDGKVYGFLIEGIGQCIKVRVPKEVVEGKKEQVS